MWLSEELLVLNDDYQSRTNTVENEKGGLVSDPYSIGSMWMNYFSQLLNVHGVNDIRHTEIHTAEPLVPEPSVFEVELAIKKLKSHKSPGIGQIPGELIKAGGRKICNEIHKLIISILNKEELPEEWKELIIIPIYKKGDKTDCSNYTGISLLTTMYKILSNILLSRLAPSSSSSVICQTTGPKPLPKRFLHIVRSRASSFN